MSPPTAPDDTLAWLRDLEALRRLPQRYARAIDSRDIDAVAALFDPAGAVDGVRGSAAVPEYLEGLRAGPAFTTSMHVLGEALVDLEPGADVAHLDTYAVVYQIGRADDPDASMTLGLRYLDEVVRAAEGWRIRHRRAQMLWNRPLRL
jgi:hypothetical protein